MFVTFEPQVALIDDNCLISVWRKKIVYTNRRLRRQLSVYNERMHYSYHETENLKTQNIENGYK